MNDIERRLLKILSASPEQLDAIDCVLENKAEDRLEPPKLPSVPVPEPEPRKAPLLLMMKDAATLLGVSRCTVWRLVQAGRLKEVRLCGAARVRRADVEALAGEGAEGA